jgi:integrase
MPKMPKFAPVQRTDGKWMVSIPPAMTSTGERVRKVFASKDDAHREGARLRALYAKGIRGGMVAASVAADASRAMAVLQGTGISLVEAARIAKAAMGTREQRELFGARWARVIAEMEMEWSDRYEADMDRLRRRMPAWLMELPCGAISRERMEEALREIGTHARSTMDMRLRMLMAISGHRERARKTTRPRILDLAASEKISAACATRAERMSVALLLWAGIRPDGEIRRLDWSDVTASEILVPPETAKTRTDRIVPITPRLAAEIAGHPSEGAVTPPDWKRTWSRIRRSAGITGWQDVTRHTFASHYLAAFGEDAAKQAMGHTAGSRTLFRHYRRAVSEESGTGFFAAPDEE